MKNNTFAKTVARIASTAHPAPAAQPGWHNHHGVTHVETVVPGYHR